MTNTTKQAESLKTWPEKFMLTIEILGKQPDHIPDYKLSEEIGNIVFVDSDHKSPVVEYIRADKVKALQLEAIRKTLEVACNESENSGQNIRDIAPEEILNSLGTPK